MLRGVGSPDKEDFQSRMIIQGRAFRKAVEKGAVRMGRFPLIPGE